MDFDQITCKGHLSFPITNVCKSYTSHERWIVNIYTAIVIRIDGNVWINMDGDSVFCLVWEVGNFVCYVKHNSERITNDFDSYYSGLGQ